MKCPDCGAELGQAINCHCGYSRYAGGKRSWVDDMGKRKCIWVTGGRQCLMDAAIFPGHVGKGGGLCEWHTDTHTADDAQNADRFDVFWSDLLRHYPEHQWIVWGKSSTWNALLGRRVGSVKRTCACGCAKRVPEGADYYRHHEPHPAIKEGMSVGNILREAQKKGVLKCAVTHDPPEPATGHGQTGDRAPALSLENPGSDLWGD